MSRLGYFIGGVLAGVIGTAVAAYAVDACSSSDSDENDVLDRNDSASMMENNESAEAEDVVNTDNEEPCTA